MLQTKVHRIPKGTMSCDSYFAILEKSNKDVTSSEAILVKYGKEIFPTVIRNYGSSRNLSGFTVPKRIGRGLENKEIKFNLFRKNASTIKSGKRGYINLGKILPDKTIRNFPLYKFDLNRSQLLFWIYARGNKPIILPKYISPENIPSLLEIFGAFVCEGLKARKKNNHIDRLSFSNAEIEQIKWFIETIESVLKINKNEWKLQILFQGDFNKFNVIKNYWSGIGVPKQNITIVKNSKISAKYGVCIANIYNSTLAEVFSSIMEYCNTISLNSQDYAIRVFRGFSRGDLGVSSRTVSFDSEKKEDVSLFKNICEKLDIETSSLRFNPCKKGWWTCYITGRKNFEKILRFDGIKHYNRRKKLIKILLRNKSFSSYKYLEAVANHANTTQKSSHLLKRSIITTRFFLSKLKKEGYLKSSIQRNQNIYHLTAKGLHTFKFYNNLENELI